MRLFRPAVLLIVLLLAVKGWPMLTGPLGLSADDGADMGAVAVWLRLGALLAGAWFAVRLLHVALWNGLVMQRTGVPAPPLLTALVDLLVWIAAAVVALDIVLHLPVAGFAATSGVAFAFAGLASRNVMSDAAAGIGMTFDKAVSIGDWVEVRGHLGQVVRMSWRSTTLRRGNGLLVTLSNSQMAESTLVVYRVWRDEFDVDLGYDVPAEQAERILLAAAAEAVPVLDPSLAWPAPIVRMIGLTPTGVRWRLLYWVDYPVADTVRSAVQRMVLRNLSVAGLRPAALSQVLAIERRSAARDGSFQIAEVIGRMKLFAGLTPGELARLADASVPRAVPSGTTVVRQGDAGESMFVIREGLFDVVIGENDWRVARMGAGDFFGELSLLTGAPRAASVRAASDAVVIEISRDALMPLVAEREVLADRLGVALVERMERNQAASAAGRAAAESPAAQAARNLNVMMAIRRFFGVSTKIGL